MRLLFTLLLIWPCLVMGQTYAGGIHSMRSPHIQITSQDIVLGLDQVKVTYVFNNTSAQNLTETLVFVLPPKSEDNFKQFSILVNQQQVAYQTVQRAISPSGQDISRELKTLGLPYNPIAAIHTIDSSPNRDSITAKLRSLQLIDKREETPMWIVKTYYYWQQEFPAKSNITIEQIYKPTVSTQNIKFNNFMAMLKIPIKVVKKIYNVATTFSFEDDAALANLQDQFEKYSPQIQTFCPKRQDYQALLRAYKSNPNRKKLIELKELHFSCDADDLWANPIGNFSLTIESPKNMHPLVCWNGELKSVANNTLKFNAENFIPLQNVNVMYVEK